MVSDVSSLVKYLERLREFPITFGLHLKKRTPVAFTLDRAITRNQEVYDFDCQCVKQVKAFLGTIHKIRKVMFLWSTWGLVNIYRLDKG